MSVCTPTGDSADLIPSIAITDSCKVYISWIGLKDCSDVSLGSSIYYVTIDQALNFTTPVEVTDDSSFDGKLVLQPQIITRPGNIGAEFNSKDASFAIVWYTDAEVSGSGTDNDILIQRFNDCGVEVGTLEVLSEGEITDGFNTSAIIGDGNSLEPALATSVTEIFIGWQELPTGSNQVFNIVGTRVLWGTDGTSGSCSNANYNYCVECIESVQDTQACGLNGRGEQTRTCTNGAWPAWGTCVDTDVCTDGDNTSSEATQACGNNNSGTQTRTCTLGQWPVWSTVPCLGADDCEDGTQQDQPCGNNDSGTQTRTCTGGSWPDWSTITCDGADDCVIDDEETQSCGNNNSGTRTRTCQQDGTWGDWGFCIDEDECQDGTPDTQSCGNNNSGTQTRTCTNGEWPAWSTCAGEDECENGDERDIICGTNNTGTQTQTCIGGNWTNFCLLYTSPSPRD